MPIINTVITGGGSAPEPYPLLSRVTDDSNNEIGTVSGYFTDANNQKYAVVCLDAQYRSGVQGYLSDSSDPGSAYYISSTALWESKITATQNCSVLDGSAITGVHGITFVIGGVTYAAQIPNIIELVDVFKVRTGINSADPTASTYSNYIVPANNSINMSSSVNDASYNYQVGGNYTYGGVSIIKRSTQGFYIPILEIPIN